MTANHTPGYSRETVERAGATVPLHIRDGIAFVYETEIDWVARIDDKELVRDPGGANPSDSMKRVLPQIDRHTIRDFAAKAQSLLAKCQSLVDAGQLPEMQEVLQRARYHFDLDVKRPIYDALVTGNDRLLTTRLEGNAYAIVVRNGTVMAVIREKGTLLLALGGSLS